MIRVRKMIPVRGRKAEAGRPMEATADVQERSEEDLH